MDKYWPPGTLVRFKQSRIDYYINILSISPPSWVTLLNTDLIFKVSMNRVGTPQVSFVGYECFEWAERKFFDLVIDTNDFYE